MNPPKFKPPIQQSTNFSFGQIPKKKGHKIVLYGTGGIGKTMLSLTAGKKIAFYDFDESLPVLKPQIESFDFELPLVAENVIDYLTFRKSLQTANWTGIDTIIIDTGTKLEEICSVYVRSTILLDHGNKAKSIEDYGWGKGYQYLYDAFLLLLADFDIQARAGRNVIILCHECTCTVPNPTGEDFLRYEPRLQNPNSGKASIRSRVKEWADHVLFLGYDIAVDKEGKGKGNGTRTLWCNELPHCLAKSRTYAGLINIPDFNSSTPDEIKETVWGQIIK